ncbi:MAG: hypothetical protein AAFP78_14640 [Pseudomonadota bacterium]
MTFVLAFIACALIGWFVPAYAAQRMPGAGGLIFGVGAALILGAAAVWLAAQATGLTGADPDAEFARGFNAWKIMILLAPASALSARRRLTKDEA